MAEGPGRLLPAHLLLPHPARLDASRADHALILGLHEAAIARGLGMYTDPLTGAAVFTAQALWSRGYCCESGCRHCPYLERAPV